MTLFSHSAGFNRQSQVCVAVRTSSDSIWRQERDRVHYIPRQTSDLDERNNDYED